MTTPNITRILADLRADFVVRQLHVDDARALVEHIERLERALEAERLDSRATQGELAALRIEQMTDCL